MPIGFEALRNVDRHTGLNGSMTDRILLVDAERDRARATDKQEDALAICDEDVVGGEIDDRLQYADVTFVRCRAQPLVRFSFTQGCLLSTVHYLSRECGNHPNFGIHA